MFWTLKTQLWQSSDPSSPNFVRCVTILQLKTFDEIELSGLLFSFTPHGAIKKMNQTHKQTWQMK